MQLVTLTQDVREHFSHPSRRSLGSADQLSFTTLICSLHSTEDYRSLLAVVLDGAAALTHATSCSFLEANDNDVEMVVAATLGPHIIPTESRLVLDRPMKQFSVNDDGSTFGDAELLGYYLSAIGQTGDSGKQRALGVPLNHRNCLLGALVLEFATAIPKGLPFNHKWSLWVEQSAVAIHRAKTLDTLRRQSGDLSAVVELESALIDNPNIKDMLGEIIERVKHVFGAEMGGVMLYDPDADELVLQRPDLIVSDKPRGRFRVPLRGKAVAAHVFLTGQHYLSNEPNAEPIGDQQVIRDHRVRNLITVPLEVERRRIGVLQLCNKSAGAFSANDLRLLGLLASHLSVLIHNARLLERERLTVVQLEELNHVIDRQREGLQRAQALHDDLTRMVLDGRGISAIIATLSKLVANPVVVRDRFGTLVGSYPLENRIHTDLAVSPVEYKAVNQPGDNDSALQEALARLSEERRPIRLPAAPQLGVDSPRVIAPIVAGHEILGHVCVLETNREIDELDVMALEHAATAAALQMMKEKAATEAQYKLIGDLVAELVSGTSGPGDLLLQRAAYLGINLRVPRAVLVIDVDDSLEAVKGGREKRVLDLNAQILDVSERACRQLSPKAVVAAKSLEITVLPQVSASVADRRSRLYELADALRAEIRRWLPEITVSVGIGRNCDALADYPKSYAQARRALDVLRTSGHHDRTLSFDQMDACGVLFDPSNRERLLSLVEDVLGGLLEYDRVHGSDLVTTLDRYLLHDCHLEPASAALHVHLNTLRYRLQRIEEVTGVDMSSFAGRFNLQLALKVLHTLNGR